MRVRFLFTLLSGLAATHLVAALPTAAQAARYAIPRWSADGKRIIFGANLENPRRMDLFSINLDGTGLVKVREDARDGSWSPDGKRVLFTAVTDGNLDLWTMNADGTNVQQVTRGGDMEYQGSWSPDGKRIVFLSIPPGENQRHDVHVINADGTARRSLTETPAAEESGPVWSPDGKQIAFASNRESNFDIYVVNADGTNLRRLSNVPEADVWPAFTPDSKALLFISSRGGSRQVWRVNVLGGDAKKIGAAVALPLVWSPDAQIAAYVGSAEGTSGIFVSTIAANNARRRVTAVPVAPTKLQQLRWLAGCWERRTSTLVTQEMWMQPDGELMLGSSRTVSGGFTTEYEQLRLEARGDTLVYTALPSRQKETEFRSMRMSDSAFVVENLAHDFPQRIMYRRIGADSLMARIEGPGPNGTRGIDYPMRKISCGS